MQGEGRVTQLQRTPGDTSSCVCLALFQRLAELLLAKTPQPLAPHQALPAKLLQQQRETCRMLRMLTPTVPRAYPKNSPGMALWSSQGTTAREPGHVGWTAPSLAPSSCKDALMEFTGGCELPSSQGQGCPPELCSHLSARWLPILPWLPCHPPVTQKGSLLVLSRS